MKKIVPEHIGLILDGNRRWAKQKGKKTLLGHKQGVEVLKTVTLGLFKKDIKYVSVYVFSTKNWNRAKSEVKYLMGLAVKALTIDLQEYHDLGVKIIVAGSRAEVSDAVLKAIDRVESETVNNNKRTLVICFNYGGRQEIVEGVKQIINSKISVDDIDESTIADNLYVPEVPDVDLLIRTSGEQRISGFMLWRVAYAELSFVSKFWPDVTLEDMNKVLEDYASRERRFGC